MAGAGTFMSKIARSASNLIDDVGNFSYINKAGNKTMLRSNEAINPLGKFILGSSDTGVRGTLNGLAKGEGVKDALKAAYTTEKGLNYGAIAGTYVGASLAGRALSGGGIYRDSTGNNNIPVLPFI